jgi:hypothetical protein
MMFGETSALVSLQIIFAQVFIYALKMYKMTEAAREAEEGTCKHRGMNSKDTCFFQVHSGERFRLRFRSPKPTSWHILREEKEREGASNLGGKVSRRSSPF